MSVSIYNTTTLWGLEKARTYPVENKSWGRIVVITLLVLSFFILYILKRFFLSLKSRAAKQQKLEKHQISVEAK